MVKEPGENHLMVNHNQQFIDRDDDTFYMNTIERILRDMRENIPANMISNILLAHVKILHG